LPLAESANERARGLVTLHDKFVADAATMNPAAAGYFRKRPYLTPEVCRQWQIGYLPRDTGGDTARGTMRGKIVYPIHNEAAKCSPGSAAILIMKRSERPGRAGTATSESRKRCIL